MPFRRGHFTFYHTKAISQLPKLCVTITIFMQGHVLIADWSVAHFVVIMNDNMAAFAHVGRRAAALVWVRSFQGHWEFPFGNSRELRNPKFPAGIPGNF